MIDDIKFNDGEVSSFIDADYQLTGREVEHVSSRVFKVIRQKAVAQNLMPTIPLMKGAKTWYLYITSEQEAPRFDDNMNREAQNEVRKTEKTFYPVFMHSDWRLNQTDQDASSNSKYFNETLAETTMLDTVGLISDYKEKVIWRGYDISGRGNEVANRQGAIDSSVKGILNTASVGAFDAGAGGDSDIKDAGDGPATIALGGSDLITAGFYGPYDVIASPEVYSCFLGNQNATTSKSDWQLMTEMIDTNGKKLLKSINISKHLIGAAESSTTGCFVMLDTKTPNGGPTILIGEEYPVSHEMHRGLGPRLIGGKAYWSGVSGVLYPTAITQDAAITSS